MGTQIGCLNSKTAAQSLRCCAAASCRHDVVCIIVQSAHMDLRAGYPFDSVKVRMQASVRGTYAGPWGCFRQILRTEGVRACGGWIIDCTIASVHVAFIVSVLKYDTYTMMSRRFRVRTGASLCH